MRHIAEICIKGKREQLQPFLSSPLIHFYQQMKFLLVVTPPPPAAQSLSKNCKTPPLYAMLQFHATIRPLKRQFVNSQLVGKNSCKLLRLWLRVWLLKLKLQILSLLPWPWPQADFFAVIIYYDCACGRLSISLQVELWTIKAVNKSLQLQLRLRISLWLWTDNAVV